MSLRAGREVLLTPGPTNIPDEVLAAMHVPAVDLYSAAVEETSNAAIAGMKRIMRTSGDAYLYAGNGHAGWEAAIANALRPGERVLVLESGRFAAQWGETAAPYGIAVELLPGSWEAAPDMALLEQRLREDREHRIAAVLTVQVDTASGVQNDVAATRRAIDAAGHPALLMVDVIASLGAVPFEFDGWGVDVAVGASQKALMMAPGLAIVAAGPKAKARAAARPAGERLRYWDWIARDEPETYRKFCGTCPEHLVFGLNRAIGMLEAEGLETAWRRHRLLAEACRRAVARWGEGGALSLNIARPEQRSNSVTVVRMAERAPELIDWCRDHCGVVLGSALGPIKGLGFRIGHMGHVNAPAILGALGVIEAGLLALGIPHGKGGVQAAVEFLAGEER
jgi:alanine-glyoxylate transaminase/serine-glyoxylate transaminase/serine-pyruvate transaminase